MWLFQLPTLGIDIPGRCDVNFGNLSTSDTIQGNIELSAPDNTAFELAAARATRILSGGVPRHTNIHSGAAAGDVVMLNCSTGEWPHGASRILMPRKVKLLHVETVSIFGRECLSSP